MPRAVMFFEGIEGCAASYLISRHRKMLDGIALDIGYSDKWNSSGRYVAGFAGGDNYVWVADVWRGKVVSKFNIPSNDWPDYEWLKAGTLLVTYD